VAAYRFKRMTEAAARAMLTWRYEGDYAMYNLDPADAKQVIARALDPSNHYYAIYDDDKLVGHCTFGREARVPGGNYTRAALDFGLGMHPNWTGKGRGAAIVRLIIAFGQTHYGKGPVRATVAAWNVRSQKAIKANGLIEVGRFRHTLSGMKFVVLAREYREEDGQV
jgi:ribosomal-protein-alanine N-acetyltransferase